MTAFYMFRLYYGIFWGTENKELHAKHMPHEAPLTMTLPLIILCVITVGVGIYTTIAGWMLYYVYKMASGQFVGLNSEQVTGEFVSMTQRPGVMVVFMVIIVVLCFNMCGDALRDALDPKLRGTLGSGKKTKRAKRTKNVKEVA